MMYVPFYEKFPELSEEETRSITCFDHPGLPNDTYFLIEAYCSDAGCDCRRVFFNVVSMTNKKVLAVIAFGWETNKYYEKWMGDDIPEIIESLKGPILNIASPQSEFAPIILELVNNVVLKDTNYIERLKKHYKLFKDKIDKKEKRGIKVSRIDKDINIGLPFVEVGRNSPCPCGSGKKYKKCCLK